jgi:hypothetical protein
MNQEKRKYKYVKRNVSSVFCIWISLLLLLWHITTNRDPKQHKFITEKFCRSEVWQGFHWANTKISFCFFLLLLLFIEDLFFLFYRFYMCDHIIWALYPSSGQNLFLSLVFWFYWRESIRGNKKNSVFASLRWK